MRLFRKKPVVIEAVQLNWEAWADVCDFVPRPWFNRGVFLDDVTLEALPEDKTSGTIGLYINTLESDKVTGALLATQGDWIIKGVKGEIYPCKPDIFESTYDKVEATSAEGL